MCCCECSYKPFLIISVLIFCGSVIPYTILVFDPAVASIANWEPISCRILSASYSAHSYDCSDDDGAKTCTEYRTTVQVYYCVESLQRCFSDTVYDTWPTRGEAQSWVNTHEPGTSHECYYDVTDPSDADLQLPFPVGEFVGFVFILLPSIVFFFLTLWRWLAEAESAFVSDSALLISATVFSGWLVPLVYFLCIRELVVPYEKAKLAMTCLICIFFVLGNCCVPGLFEALVRSGGSNHYSLDLEDMVPGYCVYCCLVVIPVGVIVPIALTPGRNEETAFIMVSVAGMLLLLALLSACARAYIKYDELAEPERIRRREAVELEQLQVQIDSEKAEIAKLETQLGTTTTTGTAV